MISLIIVFLICFCYIGLSYFFIDDKFYEQHYTIFLVINFIAWVMGMLCALAIVIKVSTVGLLNV